MNLSSLRLPVRFGLSLLPLLGIAPSAHADPTLAPSAPAPAGSEASTQLLGAPTERDNTFSIYYGQHVYDVNFIYSGDHDVSEGQPFRAISFDTGSEQGRLHVFAGRKRTPSVAQSLLSRVKEQRTLFSTRYSSSIPYPKELNFWIGGALYINGQPISDPVYFGQGSTTFRNNWWIASESAWYDDARNELRLHDAYHQIWCVSEVSASSVEIRGCGPL